jgi:hypothetical protein
VGLPNRTHYPNLPGFNPKNSTAVSFGSAVVVRTGIWSYNSGGSPDKTAENGQQCLTVAGYPTDLINLYLVAKGKKGSRQRLIRSSVFVTGGD